MKKNNIHILYIDNEESITSDLSNMILDLCEKTYFASSGEKALKLYKKYHPQVLITNISLPIISGLELVKKIRMIHPKQLILFLTPQNNSKELLKAINMQVDGYILKPVNHTLLKEKILSLIQIYENEQSAKKLIQSEERFRKIAENSQVGIFMYKKKYIYVNKALCNLTGYTQKELYRMYPWDLLQSDIQKKGFKEIAKRRLQGETFYKEYNDITIITKTKKHKIVRVSASTIALEDGYAGVGTLIDITDLIKIQEELLIYRQVIEQMNEMVYITNLNGEIIFLNSAVIQQTGYTAEELIGKKNNIFQSKKYNKKFYKNLWETILSGNIYKNTLINKKKNGEYFYEDKTITPIYDLSNKQIKYFVSTGKDITKRIKKERELHFLATIDSLTGIYNRYKINQTINEEIRRTQRYHESFALLMFDIDNFKKINDTYGHDIGDLILQELATLILSSIRQSDTFGRWGGEEFMLLAPKTSSEVAIILAEKLRKIVALHHFTNVDHITVSIGVTLFTQTSKKEKTIKKVDNALYKSKESGRNKVSFIEN